MCAQKNLSGSWLKGVFDSTIQWYLSHSFKISRSHRITGHPHTLLYRPILSVHAQIGINRKPFFSIVGPLHVLFWHKSSIPFCFWLFKTYLNPKSQWGVLRCIKFFCLLWTYIGDTSRDFHVAHLALSCWKEHRLGFFNLSMEFITTSSLFPISSL